MSKMKIGFGNDMLGNSSCRYKIIDRTVSGRYAVQRLSLHFNPFSGESFFAPTSGIQLKSDIKDIREVKDG